MSLWYELALWSVLTFALTVYRLSKNDTHE